MSEEQGDKIIRALEDTKSTMQDMLILMLAEAGVSKVDVRKIVGVGDAKVTRIWKHLRKLD